MRSKKAHKLLPYTWPGQKAMKTVRRKIHEITKRMTLSNALETVIKFLNMVIRGWRNYFRVGNSTTKFQELDLYVRNRLRQWVRARRGPKAQWNEHGFELMIAKSGLEHFYQHGICVVAP